MTRSKRGKGLEQYRARRLAANYLRAFDAWLHTRKQFTRSMREATLRDLVDGKAPVSVEEELAMAPRCAECGGPILRRGGRGATGMSGGTPGLCGPCSTDVRANTLNAENRERARKQREGEE